MTPAEQLDDRCGEHLRYRDFVTCSSDTWRRLAAQPGGAAFDNVPRQPETFAAMRELCATVLDPVAVRFAPVVLTYGFASAALARQVPERRYAAGDQHAGHELNQRGKLVCCRLGIAVDFHVPGVDSSSVARWVIEHTPFDRLYFYGPERPFHVSVGPDRTSQIVVMKAWAPGKLRPEVTSKKAFLSAGQKRPPRR